MTVSGGTILGPQYGPNIAASEASGRQCVQLNATGQYAQFTAQSVANAIVVRYSVPDTADGAGTNYTISLYTNGVFAVKLPLTSKYSWLYGNYPFTNNLAAGSPRNFFDEVHTNGLVINPGDTVRLQVDATDIATNYLIDLVDLENVAAPNSQPGGSVSVKSAPYNAAGNGVTDDTAALQNCLNANTNVWLPSGAYKITGLINLPSNRTIQGSGMWYATLVGDTVLYTNAARRVDLNGNGTNIHLADFSIFGKLNYRNDNEANDGITGAFGTNSTIARIWVEHTKTGGWFLNSQGLVVDSCRVRNTVADGIGLVVGMNSTTVTNCTVRGAGDDSLSIWPATWTPQTYSPGQNVITHCTAQNSFLGSGAAIYGGNGNRVEDCSFQDITYGCGILISTTFSVGGNIFSGTTFAQRCDLVRCGGYDPGYQWRAALQICLDSYTNGVSGLNLNNLNITNSISDGLSVIGGTGTLTNALAANVSILSYGLGITNRNGLWARSDTFGSMTVSNSAIVEYKNDSANFTFNFISNLVAVTVQANPSGRSFVVDGTNYSSVQSYSWIVGSNHVLSTTSPQSGTTGVQYVWNSWSDGGAISHTVSPASNTNYTANFTTQNYLTTSAGLGGSVSPASLWTNSGVTVNLTATASNGYAFTGWTGTGSGSYSGTNSAASVTMNAPITENASFTPLVEAMLFLQQPSNVLPGASITPEVQVQAFDINGQPLTNAAIVISLASGTGTLAGTLTRSTDASGIAHFNDLSLNQAGPKTLAAAPASGSIVATNSAAFSVIGSAVTLAFTTSTGAAVAGVPFTQQPVLKTMDAFGTPSTSGLPATLQISVGLTNSTGILIGTTNYNLGTSGSNGVVAFTDLAVSVASTNVQLLVTTGSASFGSPVAGMSIWLDGNVASSVLTNASGIVTNWLDQSGNGNNFNITIGSGGNGIRYTNTVVYGRKAVTFGTTGGTAGTELKNTTYTNVSKTISVFVVARKSVAGTAEGQYQHVFATWSGGTNPDYADSGSYSLDYNQNNNTPRIIRSNGAVDNDCPVMNPATNFHAFEYVADGFGSNGIWTAMSGSTTQGAGPNYGNLSANFNIVASSVGGGMVNGTTVNNPFAGSIAEVLVYSSALNSSNRLAVENYLRSKWIAPYSLTGTASVAFNVSAATPPPQSITGISVNTPSNATVTFAATPGFVYHVEATANLTPPAWTTVSGSTTNAAGNFVTFTDTNPLTGPQRFYRTVSP